MRRRPHAVGATRRSTRGSAPLSIRVLVLLVAAAFALVVSTPVAALGSGIGVSAKPVPGSEASDISYFDIHASPGATVRRVLLVTNLTDEVRRFSLSACDGASAVYGGVAYSSEGTPTTRVGSWIDLSDTDVTLPPRGSMRVPFEVAVPTSTVSGVHVGGVSVWEPEAATVSVSGTDSSMRTKVTTVSRLVVTVVVTCPGAAVPELNVRGMGVQVRGEGMYLVMNLANVGTAPTEGDGVVSIDEDGFRREFALGTMIPASGTEYPVQWRVDAPEGTYHATVEVRYADGTKVAKWNGPFTVGAAEKAEVGNRVPGMGNPKSAGMIYVLVGVALLIGVVAIMIAFRVGRDSPDRSGSGTS